MNSRKASRAKPAKTRRLCALDALRGLAALTVVFEHGSLMVPDSFYAQLPAWAAYNPLRIFLNGHAAVLLFFVLSGYVLAISYTENKNQSYIPFLIKRIGRIYLPFVFGIFFAGFLYANSTLPPDGLGTAAFRTWWHTEPLTLKIVAQHAAMTGIINHMWLDSPIWSLVHEMRISIIFPLLLILCRNLREAIFIALLIGFGAPALTAITGQDWALNTASDFSETLLITLRFVPFFMLGIMLAKHDDVIAAWLNHLPRSAMGWFLAATLLILYLPPGISEASTGKYDTAYQYMTDALFAAASGCLIVLARHMPRAEAWLTLPPLPWLGKISYSLYLVHVPVILFLFRSLLGTVPVAALLALTVATALITATIFHWIIERPSMRLGKYVAGMISRGQLRSGKRALRTG